MAGVACMEMGDSHGRWAHRTFVSPTQELRRQRNKRWEREGGRLSNYNASLSVATTKTHERTKEQISFTNKPHKNRGDRKSPRIQPSKSSSSLPSSSVTCWTLVTPRPTATQAINANGSDDASHHKSSRNALTTHQSPHSVVISEHTNEFINNGQREHTPLIPRLSKASLLTVQSRHTLNRGRRKSIGSRSFLSDDNNAVSSGYSTFRTHSGNKTTISQKSIRNSEKTESKPTRRRNSYSVDTGVNAKSSRAEYLRAFNDSIRLRNARTVSRRQRPTTATLPDIASTKSSQWRTLRRLVRSAPGRRSKEKENGMDGGANDSWDEFVALGMPQDEFLDVEKPEVMTSRSIQNITSSREHERVLNEFKFHGDSSYRKDGAFKKSIMVIAGGIKSMSVKNVGKSPRSSPRTPDAVLEGDESEDAGGDVYLDTAISSSKIRSRGWKIVKARLSEIAEKAPKNGIDSTPLTFKNLAQLVKAKQFRLMLKRRASFMDNGRFQFEEAKQDLYARYKLDPVLISKLTRTPRDSQAAHGANKSK